MILPGLEETEIDGDNQQSTGQIIHPSTPTLLSSPTNAFDEDKKPLKKSNSSGDILSPIVSPGITRTFKFLLNEVKYNFFTIP